MNRRQTPHQTATLPVSFLHGATMVAASDPAENYHESSKLYPATTARELSGVWQLQHNGFMIQMTSGATREMRGDLAIPLPQPVFPPRSLGEVLVARRTARGFGGGALSLHDVACLCFAAYGICGRSELGPSRLRTCPSGGALYPLDVYLAIFDVSGASPGIYHYNPFTHALELMAVAEPCRTFTDTLTDQSWVDGAAFALLIGASFWRSRFKYGLRAYRFTLLEAGHLMQNALLAAECLGVAALPLGGFYDEKLNDMLGYDGVTESILYVANFGTKAADGRAATTDV